MFKLQDFVHMGCACGPQNFKYLLIKSICVHSGFNFLGGMARKYMAQKLAIKSHIPELRHRHFFN